LSAALSLSSRLEAGLRGFLGAVSCDMSIV